MKKFIAAAALLTLFTFFLAIEGCNPKENMKIVDSLNAEIMGLSKRIDSLTLLDCNSNPLPAKVDATAKYKKIKKWSKGKIYTLCFDITLKGGAQAAIISIDEPNPSRVEILKLTISKSGKHQLVYTHLRGNFDPEISIKIVDSAGTPVDVIVNDTTVSVCGPGLTTKDKLLSTDTQGSTVYVTIDEK